ncbi:MAG: hypothetical protein JWN27_3254 [Candidatus Eremiobacteraeota bacterium]|nr:hypothetical protein [Candidatus Eremiobacteraeota bacterium]
MARQRMITTRDRGSFATIWAVAAALLLLAAPVCASDIPASALDREPCVSLRFAPALEIDSSGHRQRVVAFAMLRDGRELEGLFPYDWTYADPAHENPFFGANAFRTDLPIRIQRPPHPLAPRTVSPVIAYILEHTYGDGHLRVRTCPPLTGATDRTFSGRLTEHVIGLQVRHATDDDFVVQVASAQKGAGPITVCALALNVGARPVERVRLRWDFRLRSGTVTTSQDWHVLLSKSAAPVSRGAWFDAFLAIASHGPQICAPISDDSRLKKVVDDIEQISLTVLSVERTP